MGFLEMLILAEIYNIFKVFRKNVLFVECNKNDFFKWWSQNNVLFLECCYFRRYGQKTIFFQVISSERYSRVFLAIESPTFNTKKLFSPFSHIVRKFWGISGDTGDNYYTVYLQCGSLASHISLCKNLMGYNTKYGH